MSEIRPFHNKIQYIPRDSNNDGIEPTTYWVVSEVDIAAHNFLATGSDTHPVISDSTFRGYNGTSGGSSEGGSTGIQDLIPLLVVSGPNDVTGNETQSATFSVSSTITNNSPVVPTYRWQKKESGSSTWVTISGATSSQYTVTNLSYANDNGDQYRCVVTANTITNSPQTSRAATLTVRRLITITQQPTVQTSYPAGSSASITVVANVSSGTLNYQWQKREFLGTDFTPVPSGNSATYITPPLNSADDNQDSYRCVLTATDANTVTSNSVTLVITGTDLQITPAVSGITFWSFDTHGPLVVDGQGTNNTYQILVLGEDKNIKVDMWGQGSCNARGGYAGATVPVIVNSGYTLRLNAGGGTGGNPGGGYAGLFNTYQVTQASSILIAGGAGGGGASTTNACVYSGGAGGGLVGGDAFSIAGTGGGTSATQTASVITSNPACAGGPSYGWYTRSGGNNTNPSTGDIRQLVIKWNGSVIYNGPSTGITNGFVVVGSFRYYPSTYQGSAYGWCSDGTTCGSCSSPNGDIGNSFDIYRSPIDSYDGGKGATQTSSGAGGSGFGETVTQTFSTAGTSTISIPVGASNITYEIVGGRGGTGGTGVKGSPVNQTYPGGTGARGQKIVGTLNPSQVAGQTLTLRIAGNGGNGSANYFGASGGSAGAGLNSGGSGGSTPVSGASGADYYGASGGGGGGSSSISIGTTRLLIAGGGGGGGGGMTFSNAGNIDGSTSTQLLTTLSASNGGTGGVPSDAFNSAGGGGGGGSPGGTGGGGSQAGNSIAGEGGFGGGGYYNTTYVSGASVSTATTNAYITISYVRVVNDGINGSALQGGNGGDSTYDGGGGGGGYFGGGGGAGFSDRSTGGGGGVGYVAPTISGVTSTFVSTVSGVSRGNAGDVGQNSRIVMFLGKINITSQPTLNSSYSVGATPTISVSATITAGAGAINYQWQRKTLNNEWQDISGATSTSYTIPAITTGNAFDQYRCKLFNINASTAYSNTVIVYVEGTDIVISPAVSGVTVWSFINNGKLILDPSNSTSYTITVVNPNIEKIFAKLWGQGACGATGGFSSGIIPTTISGVYSVRLNAGGGACGQGFGGSGCNPGGGYAGIFSGTTISQGTAILIAGGAGGGGANNAPGCTGGTNFASGGGLSGDPGTNSQDTEIGSTGGGGGTQFSGGSGGNAGGQSGSALQGGQGGAGQLSGAPNASGGGGGGGGYFGGGGGGGGNDFNNGTRWSSGGGGGSGFVSQVVTSGVTIQFENTVEGGFNDPDRGNAGGIGQNSRVVIDQFSEYYVDESGRILILAATENRDPRTLIKTKGKVNFGSNTCIDDQRWQSFLNLASASSDYRLAVTLDQSPAAVLQATSFNIHKLKTANRLALRTSLTDWQPFIYGYRLAWDENSGDEGVGSDYSGLFWSDSTYYGWAYYAISNNFPFLGSFQYGQPSANWWILPPGVPDFPSSPPPERLYRTPGTYTWTCPANVTSVSVLCIGGGGGGDGGNGSSAGGGGELRYKNNIPVTPGQNYTVVVGAGGNGGNGGYHTQEFVNSTATSGGASYFINTSTVRANGGGRGTGGSGGVGDGGGNGGNGGSGSSGSVVNGAGGGGAGGYSGNGGNGSASGNGSSGAGGGGGGGAVGQGNGTFPPSYNPPSYIGIQSGSGGGTNIYGQGTNGSGGTFTGSGGIQMFGGQGSGSNEKLSTYGGGGAMGIKTTQPGCSTAYCWSTSGSPGEGGVVRIIWGDNRQFPSTNTGPT